MSRKATPKGAGKALEKNAPAKKRSLAIAEKEQKITPKQEKFCQAIVAGNSQADAYRAAYDTAKMKPETVQRNACELMKDNKVAARVVELRKVVVQGLIYGVDEAMAEAKEAFEVARAKQNGGAMVQAVTVRAKLKGLFEDDNRQKSEGLAALLSSISK